MTQGEIVFNLFLLTFQLLNLWDFNISGIPDEMRKNFTTMKAIADHTRLAPDARHNQISRFIDRINQ